MPCFDAVTSKMARNQRASGFLLCSKIVPAITETRRPQRKPSGPTRFDGRKYAVPPAVGAAKALRPFQPSEVLSAVVFIGEPTAELCLAARKFGYVHPAPRTSFLFTVCSYPVDTLNAS